VSLLLSVDWEVRIGGATLEVRRRAARLSRAGVGVERSVHRVACVAAPWDAMLAALDGCMEAELPARRALRRRARVILPDCLVRYAVLPWNPALAGRAEEQAYLRHRFGQLYDNDTAGWHMRVEPGHGRTRLASAVEPALVESLGSLMAARGIALDALVPALADTVNRERARLAHPNGWLACHDSGCLCLAGWHGWQWTSARSFRAGPHWEAALPSLLAREECLHDGAGPADIVYLEDRDGNAGGAPLPGWHTERLGAARDEVAS